MLVSVSWFLSLRMDASRDGFLGPGYSDRLLHVSVLFSDLVGSCDSFREVRFLFFLFLPRLFLGWCSLRLVQCDESKRRVLLLEKIRSLEFVFFLLQFCFF